MLKSSKLVKHISMSQETESTARLLFIIIDKSTQTDYEKIFNLVYIDPKKMTLIEIAEQCFISRHTLLNRITMLNSFINNIELFMDDNNELLINVEQI